MFMFFCIFLYSRVYNYMYLCKNKGKNMTKITIRLMIPMLRIQILQLAMSTNFTQNWREHCTVKYSVVQICYNFVMEECGVNIPILQKGH